MKKRTALSLLPGALALFAPLAHGDLNDVSYGGFVSVGYIETSQYNYLVDSEGGSFQFAEVGLNASWSPLDRTKLNGQLFAFELGQYGNYDPIIDYLFVDYSVNQAFGIQAGRVKHPYGIYTEIQDIDVARASILLPGGFYERFSPGAAVIAGSVLLVLGGAWVIHPGLVIIALGCALAGAAWA